MGGVYPNYICIHMRDIMPDTREVTWLAATISSHECMLTTLQETFFLFHLCKQLYSSIYNIHSCLFDCTVADFSTQLYSPQWMVINEKVKWYHKPLEGRWWGAHLPYLGLEPIKVCDVSKIPDLRLPSQPQDITAVWLVPNYTAWWQRRVCEQLATGHYPAALYPGVKLMSHDLLNHKPAP